jgi:diguanylate cyclase (GGDEF)-like protein
MASCFRSKVRYRGWSLDLQGLRRQWRALARRPIALILLVLAAVELGRLVVNRGPVDFMILALVVLLGLAVALERDEVSGLESSRRTEAESFARILSGLSRSVSPDAIVDAIVEELGTVTGADHVGVVRRQPEARNLEATLSPTRAGAPASRTFLPLAELEDPAIADAAAHLAITASRGRRMASVRIDPDPGGDPDLVPLGLARAGVGAVSASATARSVAASSSAAPSIAGRADAPPARRRGHAVPTREGADQRIADRIADRLRDAYGLHNLIAAPLRVNGRVEGAIVLSRRTGQPWGMRARRILEAAAIEASAALTRVYTLREAEVRATTDALTGLPNRRYFDEYLGLLARRRRAEDQVGVLMVDIDRFKKLNDTFGHAVGDHVLREVAQAIAGAVREGDVPTRFGGEEFAVVLRNPGESVAAEVGERVRRAVADLDLRRWGVPGVSVSVGVAVATSPDDELEDVIEQADRALFRAKRAGRDRVVAA